MKNPFNSKEQAVAFIVLCVLGVIVGDILLSGSGTVGEFSLRDISEREWRASPVQQPEYTDPDFANYWNKNTKGIFSIERGLTRVPLPDIAIPTPPAGDIAVFLLNPSPPINNGSRFYYLKSNPQSSMLKGSPLQSQRLAELLALKEPERKVRQDRRNERERENTIIHSKNQMPMEGKILTEDENTILFETEKYGRIKFKKEDIIKIEPNWTYEEKYKFDTKSLKDGDYEGHYRLYEWCLSMGMVPEAMDELKKAISIKQDFLKAYDALVALYREKSDFESEIRLYNQAMSVPTFSRQDFRCRLGDVYLALGMRENALDEFSKVIDESPGHERARVSSGRMLISFGRYSDAVKQFTRAIEFNKSSVAAYGGRGLANLYLGDTKAAMSDIGKATSLGDKTAETLNALAVLNFLNGKYGDASTNLYDAIKQDQYLTSAWLNLGCLYLLSGTFKDAENVFKSAYARDPANSYTVIGAGLARLMSGSTDRALNNFEDALDIEPKNFYANYAMAVTYLWSGKYKEAEKFFQSAMQLNYDFAPLCYNSAVTYFRQGRYKEAKTLLKRLLAIDSNDAMAKVALGCAYLGEKEYVEAESLFQEARNINPNDPFIWNALGYINYNYGDEEVPKRLANAKQFFQTALRFSQGDKQASDYASKVIAIIDDFESKKMFEDRFDRTNSADVGKGWTKIDRYGVEIKIENGRCVFSGKQKVEDMGATIVERRTPAEDFISLELLFIPDKLANAEGGMRLDFSEPAQGMRMGVYMFVNNKGKLVYGVASNKDMNPRWTESKYQPQSGSPIRFSIVKKMVEESASLDIYANDNLVTSINMTYTQSRDYVLSIFGRAVRREEYKFAIDDIRIYEKRSKKRDE